MNNHFHLQAHEQHNNNNMPQNVAPQFAAGTPTTYSYLTPAAPATANPQQQWLTYQILPPVTGNAVGGLPSVIGGPKRYYAANTTAAAATTAAATAATHHPSSIQITNNYTQQQQQQTASAFKANNINNIRIISTAPNVYSLNKTTEQLSQLYAAPTSTTTTTAAAAATATAELYAPVGAYFAAANLQSKLQPPPLVPVSNNGHSNNNSNSVANNAASTVVLDRINICINNHYAEPNLCQPSPIIPAIQHKAKRKCR